MKTYILITTMAGVMTLTACSQDIPESEVPSVVHNALILEFTGATEVEWEKKGAFYEVEFEVDNIDHKALIEETGNLVKYKKELPEAELPEAIRSSLSGDPDYSKIDDVHQLIIDENSYYLLEFEGLLTDEQKVYNEAGEEKKDIIYFD